MIRIPGTKTRIGISQNGTPIIRTNSRQHRRPTPTPAAAAATPADPTPESSIPEHHDDSSDLLDMTHTEVSEYLITSDTLPTTGTHTLEFKLLRHSDPTTPTPLFSIQLIDGHFMVESQPAKDIHYQFVPSEFHADRVMLMSKEGGIYLFRNQSPSATFRIPLSQIDFIFDDYIIVGRTIPLF